MRVEVGRGTCWALRPDRRYRNGTPHVARGSLGFCLRSPNELVTEFPLVLIPTFLVPLSILLHVMTLTKLKRITAGLKTSSTRTGFAHS